jgi:glutamate N-acetyltransferase/amino-acid N-acetyltransferase
MVEETDALLSPLSSGPNRGKETLVMSTGVIGQPLPIASILSGIRSQASTSPTRVLGTDFSSWESAAQAFMTTDTFPKLRARTFVLGGREYRMAGMSKGAGMIHPDMVPAKTEFGPLHATLLGCIMTDMAITPRALQSALTYAVDRSFNSISVDGDMSTNDTICVLANGAAAPDGSVLDENTHEYEIFKEELTNFAADLAKLVVRDGEGATKFVTVTVKVGFIIPMFEFTTPTQGKQGAPTYKEAHSIASRISTSALVKTALYGEDAKYVIFLFHRSPKSP